MTEDLELMRLDVHKYYFHHYEISTRQELFETLQEIARLTKKVGLKPIIHFDMHGNKHLGLESNPTREYTSWSELVVWLRKINIRAKNNLCVIAAT